MIDLDAQLALAGGHDRAVSADPVAEVERLNASNASSPMTALETNSCTSSPRSRDGGEDQLALSRSSITRPATRDLDRRSRCPARAIPTARAQLGERVRAVEAVRIRLVAAGAERVDLAPGGELALPPARCRQARYRAFHSRRSTVAAGIGRDTGATVAEPPTPRWPLAVASRRHVATNRPTRSRSGHHASSAARRLTRDPCQRRGGHRRRRCAAPVLPLPPRRRHGSIDGLGDVAVVFDLQDVDPEVVAGTFAAAEQAGRRRRRRARASVGLRAITRAGCAGPRRARRLPASRWR